MAIQTDELRLAIEKLEKEILTMRSILDQILSFQQQLIEKSKSSNYSNTDSGAKTEDGLDVGILLKLPDHLRKTMLALAKIIEGRADEVSEITSRARAIESGYLNQLVRLGYVKKFRRKHQIYFSINSGD